jgi:acetoacetyl-CoA reductase/3-oxoacyl-[acyl-carrier protein] reductase
MAEAFIGKLTQDGLKGSIHQGNIASAEDCRRTVGEVIEQHGRLDILVHNAGITIDKTVLKLTDEDWYKVIAVNLSGAFFMSQAHATDPRAAGSRAGDDAVWRGDLWDR